MANIFLLEQTTLRYALVSRLGLCSILSSAIFWCHNIFLAYVIIKAKNTCATYWSHYSIWWHMDGGWRACSIPAWIRHIVLCIYGTMWWNSVPFWLARMTCWLVNFGDTFLTLTTTLPPCRSSRTWKYTTQTPCVRVSAIKLCSVSLAENVCARRRWIPPTSRRFRE